MRHISNTKAELKKALLIKNCIYSINCIKSSICRIHVNLNNHKSCPARLYRIKYRRF